MSQGTEESIVDVAVIGAGPYGLSVAAHLSQAGCSIRAFGHPLQTWAETMPQGMMLKSDGFASNLSAPDGSGTLAEYCARNAIPYQDIADPVALQTFVAYGQDFQRRHVPFLTQCDVISVDRHGTGFRLVDAAGGSVFARVVVAAVGVTHFRVVPEVLAGLPSDLATHSADHHRLEKFAGRRVAVVGSGASAVDLAAALIAANAKTTLVTRRDKVRFSSKPDTARRSLLQSLRHPSSPLGPGWRSRLVSDFPGLFHYLPAEFRLNVVHRHLGPRSPWYLKASVTGGATMLTGQQIVSARTSGEGVTLGLAGAEGVHDLHVDHVVSATGYWPQVDRMQFLDAGIRNAMRHVNGVPVLSSNFETSVPGLYLTGLAASGSFGPLMRFVAGAEFSARRVSRHVTQQRATDAHRK